MHWVLSDEYLCARISVIFHFLHYFIFAKMATSSIEIKSPYYSSHIPFRYSVIIWTYQVEWIFTRHDVILSTYWTIVFDRYSMRGALWPGGYDVWFHSVSVQVRVSARSPWAAWPGRYINVRRCGIIILWIIFCRMKIQFSLKTYIYLINTYPSARNQWS